MFSRRTFLKCLAAIPFISLPLKASEAPLPEGYLWHRMSRPLKNNFCDYEYFAHEAFPANELSWCRFQYSSFIHVEIQQKTQKVVICANSVSDEEFKKMKNPHYIMSWYPPMDQFISIALLSNGV